MAQDPGTSSRIVRPHITTPKVKLGKNQRVTTNTVSNLIRNNNLNSRTVKYTETLVSLTPITSTGTFILLTQIPQGPSQSQRIADTAWLQRIDINWSVNTANADIHNIVRKSLLTWQVSTALAGPTTSDMFTNFINAFTYSHWNFENRHLYNVISDELINLTGTSTNPTSYSQHSSITSLALKNRRIDFTPAATTATGHLYLFLSSDSLATPFPIIDLNLRVWYYDE
jgi:hypothetical protein